MSINILIGLRPVKRSLAALPVLLLFVLGGCSRSRKDEPAAIDSRTKLETATVVEIIRVPATHGPAAKRVDTVDWPEQYTFVLECEHGRFVVQYPSPLTQWLAERFGSAVQSSTTNPWWMSLKPGDQVNVFHREEYRVDSGGRRHLVADFAEMNATEQWAEEHRSAPGQ